MKSDTGKDFYIQLEEACREELPLSQRYDMLHDVFQRVVAQATYDCRIVLVGLFAKTDYCIKEYQIPEDIASLIHDTRKELFPDARHRKEMTDERLRDAFAHNLKATAFLVYYLCSKEAIPTTLKRHFTEEVRKSRWGKYSEKVLRTIVERWNEESIWVREEENATLLLVCYSTENKYLNRDGNNEWAYLKDILWEGAVLNLVRIRMIEEVCMPELIILEPDYLINITTIASCFETYAESPFVNLINKIKPSANTIHIHLGNLSGQLLDDTVHGRNTPFEESFSDFVRRNSLNLITCQEFISGVKQFKEDGEAQKRNIEQLIGHDLPASISGYDSSNVILEPSFFSSTLGIQGRFDYLNDADGDVTIIEQKSGKGEFVPYGAAGGSADTPVAKEQHTVQALLYRALYAYEFNRPADHVRAYLLYSKYKRGLLELPPMPSLFLRAIRMRNLLAWSEFQYATKGMDILAKLTPEKLNRKGVSGKLWCSYTRPELELLLHPIHDATPLERAYYLRFMQFLENELLHSKLGNKRKENSGFASLWHDTLEDKKAAGNIYDKLVIDGYGMEGDTVATLTMKFLEPQSSGTTNFRIGDIVILYPYRFGEVPNACAQMVSRASIMDIREDTLELRLRNAQTDKKVFAEKPKDTLWAIEHDMFESSTGALYSAMHSFLSAPKERRDLLLSQRQPQTDEARMLKGEYGSFNTLSLRAKRAKELFLIIGPPGTGKTSYGLVNLLKEEMLEDSTNVLLLSYTNRAVDEICSKLMEIKQEDESFDYIRIGSDLSCATEYREHLLSTRSARYGSGNEINKMIRQCRVFCGTTSAINANMSLLKLKHFSLAIIDESSQILEPHLIGLFSACDRDGKAAIDKFVLIGDHKQLPAVVQQSVEESEVTEPELRAINLHNCRLSLFERLLRQFKNEEGYDERFVYMLTKQGRMHQDIAEFPNKAFYGGKLNVVPLKHQLLLNKVADTNNGIMRMLTSRRIAFVASEPQTVAPSVKTNSIEAAMIAATVRQIYELTKKSFDEDRTVGVIVPYRNQITTVRNAIDSYGIDALHNITIDTVERYQGSQRDYIIYGFTVNRAFQLNFLTDNTFEEEGVLIDRKLNVAMTRARLSLIMIGNPDILSQDITFKKLLDFVKAKDSYLAPTTEDYCRGTF